VSSKASKGPLLEATDSVPKGERPQPKRVRVRKDKTNPRRIAYLCLLLFAVPPSWPLLAAGAALVLFGIFFHGWAAGYLARAGYEERESVLTARGPYRRNRNPYYVAQMTMDLGFFCLAGLPLFYLLYFPLIFFVYRRWVKNEEPFLEREFGEAYEEFKREVPRWRIRLTPAPARGHEQRFEWAAYMENRELHRSVSHLIVLAIFIAYNVWGNPFTQVNPILLVTIVCVVASWLLVRDISAIDTREFSQPWLLAGFGIAAAGMVLLAKLPLWEPWAHTVSWIEVGGALVCGAIVVASTLPIQAKRAKSKNKTQRGKGMFSNPLCQWYMLALGLGLLSCQLGGIWLASLGMLVLWALNLSGVFHIRALPVRLSSSLAVLALFAAGVALSAQYLVD